MATNENAAILAIANDLGKQDVAYNGIVQGVHGSCTGMGMPINDNTYIGDISYPGYGGGFFPPSPPITKIPCQHVVQEHTVWDDGRVTGVCMSCNERVTFTTIPGGVGTVRIRRILEEISSPAIGDIADYLDEVDRVSQLIELEIEELEMAQKRAILAKKLLLDRLSKQNAKAMDSDLS